MGRAPSLSAREASSTRASASSCAVVRRSISVSVLGRGAASGLSVLGVEVDRASKIAQVLFVIGGYPLGDSR